MLTMTRQIKAARSLLGWEQNDLARNAGVAISTIRRIEGLREAPLSANFVTIEKIRSAFEQAGIEFLGNPRPGVRLSLGGDPAHQVATCQQTILDPMRS